MARYSLIGVDGNAFSIMGHTARALKDVGREDMVKCMHDQAMAGDYNHLLMTCQKYIDIANREAGYER